MNPLSLKIGILTHIKHPIREPFAGGLEAFTHDITRHLRQRGHDVTLFAHGDSMPELKVKSMTPVGSYRTSAAKHDHDTLSSDFIAEHHAYMDCLQTIDNHDFDIIFNNALHYVPVTMSGMIRTPMLTVLHTPPFFEMINAIAAQHKRGGGNYCTVSRSNAADWGELTPDCHVIANGIDLDQWRPSKGIIGAHAFWYGRLVPDKGAHFAIDAARLAGVPLRIAGQAIDRDYFDQEIAPRLGDDVVYLGHLSRSELAEELGRASVCLVTPCWNEPFGLVVAEALACGTPVAAFSRGAIPELLTNETGSLAEPGDAASLAAALLSARLLDRGACRRHARSRWDIDSMLVQYEELLTSLARTTLPDYG
ncbi:glycosyltransferase [Burkholderia sp. Leaf177]|uniref:glycosyltransferase n=1 Tax=Burkholderia sp. Leaf177 TaxID=1736287 RepID=UPI000A60C72C|nr:glycosyltransferase [Burkholderia sp. Leaf177]